MKAINLNLETIQKYTQHYINKRSNIMKQQLRVFLTLLLCVVASVGWGQTNTYKLVKVTSVEKNGLYVFEQDGHVAINSVTDGKLKTTDNYLTIGLTGTESYVWGIDGSSNACSIYSTGTSSANKYLNNSSGGTISLGVKSANKTLWTFTRQDDNTVLIQNTKNDNYYLGYTDKDTYLYKTYAPSGLSDGYHPHAIVVYQLVPSVSVSISDAGLATFSSVKALDFTNCEEVSAYKAKVEGSQVTLTKVNVVPAETGVLLRSMTGGAVTADIPVAATAEAIEDNAFVAVLTEIPSLDTETTVDGVKYVNYILNRVNGVTDFYKAAGKKVGAGKAYLRVKEAAASKGLTIGYADETDGIHAIGNENVASDGIYDLSGRRLSVSSATSVNSVLPKGIYIVNGKKIVMK